MINAYALLEVDGVQKTLPAAAEGPLGCGLAPNRRCFVLGCDSRGIGACDWPRVPRQMVFVSYLDINRSIEIKCNFFAGL
jgi:hypothetical protein